MSDEKECHNCGMKFKPKRFWQRFCDRTCKTSYEAYERRQALAAFRATEVKETTS